jgi:hypothetical protein
VKVKEYPSEILLIEYNLLTLKSSFFIVKIFSIDDFLFLSPDVFLFYLKLWIKNIKKKTKFLIKSEFSEIIDTKNASIKKLEYQS